MNKIKNRILLWTIMMSFLMGQTFSPVWAGAGLKTLKEGIKYTVGKTTDWAKDAALQELHDRWFQRYGDSLIDVSDESVFKKYATNIGLITDALKVGEALYAGDYKTALGTAELTALVMAVPVAGQIIAVGKIFIAYMEGLDEEIYSINKKTVYAIFQKDLKLWQSEGIDRFIDRYLLKDQKLRGFMFEYAVRDLNRPPVQGTEWFNDQKWWQNRTKTRVIVAALRNEFRPIYEKEQELATMKIRLQKGIKEMYKLRKYLLDNQDWLEKRAREIQEERERARELNRQLRERARKTIREADSDIPDTPSAKKNASHLKGEAYQNEMKRINTIQDKNRQITDQFRDYGVKMPNLLGTVILKNDPEWNRSDPSGYDLFQRFGPSVWADPKESQKAIENKLNQAAAKFPRTVNLQDLDQQLNKLKGLRAQQEEKRANFERILPAIKTQFETVQTETQTKITKQKALINQIQITGYEDYDKSIRYEKRRLDKLSIQRELSLDRDALYLRNILAQEDAVRAVINSELEAMEEAEKAFIQMKTIIAKINQAIEAAADFRKTWEDKEFSSLSELKSDATDFRSYLDVLEKQWDSLASLSHRPNPFDDAWKDALIFKSIEKILQQGRILTKKFNDQYKKAYTDSEDRIALQNSLVQFIRNDQGRNTMAPKESFGMNRLHYPVADPQDPSSGGNRLAYRILSFEKGLKAYKQKLENHQKNLANLKITVSQLNSSFNRLLSELTFLNDMTAVQQLRVKVFNWKILMLDEVAAYDEAIKNFSQEYREMIQRTTEEKLEAQKETEARRLAEEEYQRAREQVGLFRAYLSDQDVELRDIRQLKRYFDLALTNRQVGYAQTLFLGAQERLGKIILIHDRALDEFASAAKRPFLDEVKSIMNYIIDRKTKAEMTVQQMQKKLKTRINDVSDLNETGRHLRQNLDVDDIINGVADSDGDGVSDRDELQNGSDPTNSNSTNSGSGSGTTVLGDTHSIDFSTGTTLVGQADDITFYPGAGTPYLEPMLSSWIKKMAGDFNTAPAFSGGGYGGYTPVSVGDYLAVYTGNTEATYAKVYVQAIGANSITLKWWYNADGSRNF